MQLFPIIIFLTSVSFNGRIGIHVKVGDYPEYSSYDINRKECGLTYIPSEIQLHFYRKCFTNVYQNFTYVFTTSRKMLRHGSNRIYGGYVAGYAEAPWAVSIVFVLSNSTGHPLRHRGACSGVLIAFQWVLTAAHCFEDNEYFFAVVDAGKQHKVGSELRYSRLGFKYTDYDHNWLPGKYVYDTALFKLDQPFSRNRSIDESRRNYDINTICLPQMNATNRRRELATAFGYGLVDNNRTTDELHAAEFEISAESVCNAPLICALFDGRPNKAKFCGGDSGGGLVQYTDKFSTRAIVIGTAISTLNRSEIHLCSNTKMGFWVRISKTDILEWILETIKTNN